MKNKINEILIASGNRGKLIEISELLNQFGINSILATDFDIKEPEETGNSFEANATLKAKYYGDITNLTSLADDSGICIDLLDGKPGIHSARLAINEQNGEKDFNLAFERIKQSLIEKGINLENYIEKQLIKAHFICNLTLYFPDTKLIKSFEGRIDGRIIFPPRGNKGFGYDPIFIADGFDKTFGEILTEQKDLISHRSKAFKQLKDYFHL